MYKKETEMYPDIIVWLNRLLVQEYKKKSIKISVLDTHDSDLSNFIIKLKYQKYFPEHVTYKIRQDITGFIEYRNKVELVFVECKNSPLTLIHLSQLIGYSVIALPITSFLLSPKGISTTLNKLIKTYNRKDILEFKCGRKIKLIKWDINKKDIDYMESII